MTDIVIWNDGKCMSFVNDKTNGKRRCNKKAIKCSDFCSLHKNKNLYYDVLLSNIKKEDSIKNNINTEIIKNEIDRLIEDNISDNIINKIKNKNNYLDSNFEYTLMGIYNSWNDIKYSNQIFIDNEYWFIDILTNSFTFQLNNSNMENPYPIYPNNPFNRKSFSPNNLMLIKQRLLFLKKPINITLKLLFNLPPEILNICYSEALSSHDGFSQTLLDILLKEFRFMILNTKNSQDSYIGIWVTKNTPTTQFELLYQKYKNIPYQIYQYGYIIDNPYRQQLKYVLDSQSQDYYDPINKKFLEKL